MTEANYESEDDTTFFYLIVYKKTKDSEVEVSRRFLKREAAMNDKLYIDSRYKRIVRLEVKDDWLRQI